jgi:RNA polymerase sigma-70 factor (ECF subfamily)
MHILRNTFLTSRSGLSAQRTASFEDNENVDELSSITSRRSRCCCNWRARKLVDAFGWSAGVYREMILLSDIEELSYKEIAQVLVVPIGAVMTVCPSARPH